MHFDEDDFSTAEQFLTELRPTGHLWGDSPEHWCFRGQRDATWPLTPTLFREKAWAAYISPSFADAPDVEFASVYGEAMLLREFFLYVDQAGLPIPGDQQKMRTITWWFDRISDDQPHPSLTDRKDAVRTWPPLDAVPLMALARHYGLASRLIDWTWRPMVAAYFAAVGAAAAKEGGAAKETDRLAVYALNTHYVRMRWGDEDSANPQNTRVRLVTAPRAGNPNMSAQAGIFTLVHGAMKDDSFVNEFGEPEEVTESWRVVLEGAKPGLRKLTLPLSECGKLLRLVGLEGTDAAAVFPGYQGVVEAMNERRFWPGAVRRANRR